MEIYALTFVKLAECRIARFDPSHEDQFYANAGYVPGWLCAWPRYAARIAVWLVQIRRGRSQGVVAVQPTE